MGLGDTRVHVAPAPSDDDDAAADDHRGREQQQQQAKERATLSVATSIGDDDEGRSGSTHHRVEP